MITTMGCSPWNRNGVGANLGKRVALASIVVSMIGMADIDVLRKEGVNTLSVPG